MTLVKSKFGSKPELSPEFIKKIEKSGVVETICNFMKFGIFYYVLNTSVLLQSCSNIEFSQMRILL